jgi:hypothetical protein
VSNVKVIVGDELGTVDRGVAVVYFTYYHNVFLDVVTRKTKTKPVGLTYRKNNNYILDSLSCTVEATDSIWC